jgi:phospholipase/carboxylesterase
MSQPTDLGFIHRFVPGTDASQPALLLLHGTGGNEDDLLPLGQAIAKGAALLSPRGQVLENGMPRFFRRIAEGVFDQSDLKLRTEQIRTFIEEAEAAYGLPPQKLIAAGFSNGANIAASLLLRYPDALAGAVLIRAMVPFVPETTPNLQGKPILLLSGTADGIVPPENTQRLHDILQSAGANVQLHWERAGHGLTKGDLTTAQAWFAQHFPGQSHAR